MTYCLLRLYKNIYFLTFFILITCFCLNWYCLRSTLYVVEEKYGNGVVRVTLRLASSKAYEELCQTSKIERFAQIVKVNLTCLTEFWKACFLLTKLNPLSVNPTKWSITLKQFVGNTQHIVVCLTILWVWRLNG